jgi:hypothetical protein
MVANSMVGAGMDVTTVSRLGVRIVHVGVNLA